MMVVDTPLVTGFSGRCLVDRVTRQPSVKATQRLADWPVRALAVGVTKEASSPKREYCGIPWNGGVSDDFGNDDLGAAPSPLWPPRNRDDDHSLQNPLLRLKRTGCGWPASSFEWEEVIAFGGIPESAVLGVGTSERIKAQPNADATQLERAQSHAQARDDILYSGNKISSQITIAAIPNDVVVARASKLGISIGMSPSNVSESIHKIKDIDLQRTLALLKKKDHAVNNESDFAATSILDEATRLSSDLSVEEQEGAEAHKEFTLRPSKPVSPVRPIQLGWLIRGQSRSATLRQSLASVQILFTPLRTVGIRLVLCFHHPSVGFPPPTEISNSKKDPRLTASFPVQPNRPDRRAAEEMASAAGEDTVRASHILIKHEGSRRKASWKDPEGRVISATTRADAAARLGELRDQILSGRGSFADLAAQHSDCSSARRGGDLGTFGRRQMQKPFEDATYALKVGEISDIIDTESGVHIILRTA
ncbi:hypothetical protein ACQ4PT_046077 [Festuca glaucescens]